MAYFPFMMNLEDRKVLIVGAGKVAFHKINVLKQFCANISVVSEVFLPEIWNDPAISCKKASYHEQDLKGAFAVVCTCANPVISKKVFLDCQAEGILCNCADQPEYCNFYFPAVIVQDDLCVAVSSSGASPSAVSYLKKRIQTVLPGNISEVLSFLKDVRTSRYARSLPFEKKQSFMKQLTETAFEKGVSVAGKTLSDISSEIGKDRF